MSITCIIRYQIDPFQREAFRENAENWGQIIPKCGGHLVGYFLPHEGTNDIGWGLIAFERLAAYEEYKRCLKADPEAQANSKFATEKRFVVREERNFVETVEGAFWDPARKWICLKTLWSVARMRFRVSSWLENLTSITTNGHEQTRTISNATNFQGFQAPSLNH